MLSNTYIILPYVGNLRELQLQYRDIFTYLTLRSFHNHREDECFPSYSSVADRSGMCRPFIIKSLARLEHAGLIKIIKSGKFKEVNHYKFKDFDHFNCVSYKLFEQPKLTPSEKAILLCLRQFFHKDMLTTCCKINDFARALGLSYDTVYKQYNGLLDKGYIMPELEIWKDGILTFKPARLSNILDWKFDFQPRQTPYRRFAFQPQKVSQSHQIIIS